MIGPLRIVLASLLIVAGLANLLLHEHHLRVRGEEFALPLAGLVRRGGQVPLDIRERLPGPMTCPELLAENHNVGEGWIGLERGAARGRFGMIADNSLAVQKRAFATVKGQAWCPSREPDGLLAMDFGVSDLHLTGREQAAFDQLIAQAPPDAQAFVLLSIGDDMRARAVGVRLGDKVLRTSWPGF